MNSAIKSDVFKPYIKSCIFNVESLENRKVFYFCLQLLSRKYAWQHFHPKRFRKWYRQRQILSSSLFIWNFIINLKFMVPIIFGLYWTFPNSWPYYGKPCTFVPISAKIIKSEISWFSARFFLNLNIIVWWGTVDWQK